MPPLLLANGPEPELLITYVMLSIAYFTIAGLIMVATSCVERRLILLGLLTIIASVGYSNFLIGPGMVVTPTITKLGVLFILAGIVSRLLEPRENSATDPVVQELTSAFRQAAESSFPESANSSSHEEH